MALRGELQQNEFRAADAVNSNREPVNCRLMFSPANLDLDI